MKLKIAVCVIFTQLAWDVCRATESSPEKTLLSFKKTIESMVEDLNSMSASLEKIVSAEGQDSVSGAMQKLTKDCATVISGMVVETMGIDYKIKNNEGKDTVATKEELTRLLMSDVTNKEIKKLNMFLTDIVTDGNAAAERLYNFIAHIKRPGATSDEKNVLKILEDVKDGNNMPLKCVGMVRAAGSSDSLSNDGFKDVNDFRNSEETFRFVNALYIHLRRKKSNGAKIGNIDAAIKTGEWRFWGYLIGDVILAVFAGYLGYSIFAKKPVGSSNP